VPPLGALHPWPRDPTTGNDASTVLGVGPLLLLGDAEQAAEARVAGRLPGRFPILKVAHHGSRTSTTPALLQAARPVLALVSVGADNPFGHPHPDVLARLAAYGIPVLRTDRDGTITVDVEHGLITVRARRSTRASRCDVARLAQRPANLVASQPGTPRLSRVAHIIGLLMSTACGRPSEPCTEPLDAYCLDCRTFDEALNAEEAAVDPGKWDSVVAFACGQHHLAMEYDVWFQHVTEYYVAASGELVGVDSSQDAFQKCTRGWTGTTLFGDVPSCEPTCVLFERCAEGATCESLAEPCFER
jgi:hypothetical protein